jgi:hypothetical protein
MKAVSANARVHVGARIEMLLQIQGRQANAQGQSRA